MMQDLSKELEYFKCRQISKHTLHCFEGLIKTENFQVLLPDHAKAKSVIINNKNIAFKQSTIEHSDYTDFEVAADNIKTIEIKYE